MASLIDIGLQVGDWWQTGEKIDEAGDLIEEGFDQGTADVKQYADPWVDAGLDSLDQYQQMGPFDYTHGDYLGSDAYKFQRDEGQQGLERLGAKTGLFNSGNLATDISKYNVDYAGTQYEQDFRRQLDAYGTNMDYYGRPMELGATAANQAGQYLSDISIGKGGALASLEQARAASMSNLLGSAGSSTGAEGDSFINDAINSAWDWATSKLGLAGTAAADWVSEQLGIGAAEVMTNMGLDAVVPGTEVATGGGVSPGAVQIDPATGLPEGGLTTSSESMTAVYGATGAIPEAVYAEYLMSQYGLGTQQASMLAAQTAEFGMAGDAMLAESLAVAETGGTGAVVEGAAAGSGGSSIVAAGMWAAAAYVGYKILSDLFSHERNTSWSDLGEEALEKTSDPWLAGFAQYNMEASKSGQLGYDAYATARARGIALDVINNPKNADSSKTEVGANFVWDALFDTLSGSTNKINQDREWIDNLGKAVNGVYGRTSDTVALNALLENVGQLNKPLSLAQWQKGGLSPVEGYDEVHFTVAAHYNNPDNYKKYTAQLIQNRSKLMNLTNNIMNTQPNWTMTSGMADMFKSWNVDKQLYDAGVL